MSIIAYYYHWDRNTIIDLSRSERKMWFKLIQIQKREEGKALSAGKKKSISKSTYRESK